MMLGTEENVSFYSEFTRSPDEEPAGGPASPEADTAVVQSWLPGPLLGMLRDLGLTDIAVASRVVIFPQELGAAYLSDVGRHAEAAGAITAAELQSWLAGIADLHARQLLFGTVGYFLFTATV